MQWPNIVSILPACAPSLAQAHFDIVPLGWVIHGAIHPILLNLTVATPRPLNLRRIYLVNKRSNCTRERRQLRLACV